MNTYVLKLKETIVIDGTIACAGQLVEMVESEAKALLRRGQAELNSVLGEAGEDGKVIHEEAAQAAAEVTKSISSKLKGGK